MSRENMKIYLAGSIAAGRKFANNLELICNVLEKMGHKVVTKGNVVKTLAKYTNKFGLKSRRAIMKRDKIWIIGSDAFIAEVSTYSHGVGYEHAFAEGLGKPILLLRDKSLIGEKYSAFLDGTDYKKFMFSFYDENDVDKILKIFLKEYFK